MRRKDFDRNKFITETWPEALESGEFEQANGILKNRDGKFCCLGVACELLSRERLLSRKAWNGQCELPQQAIDLLGITDLGDFEDKKKGEDNLAALNDSGKSFKQIAKKIRSINANKRWIDPRS